jgi:hypothetical protein
VRGREKWEKSVKGIDWSGESGGRKGGEHERDRMRKRMCEREREEDA